MNTVLAGVVGWPVSHSLSPRLHSVWLREHAINGAYVALPVRRSDLSEALAGFRDAGFSGVNLTLPHKEAAFALAHSADPAARAAKAANLLLFQECRLNAFNTDIEGLFLSLKEGLRDSADGIRRAVVLGAGGAARAAVLACDYLGVTEIHVLNRTHARANALVQDVLGSTKARVASAKWDSWEALAPETRLVINATSAGLCGSPPLEIPLELLPRNAAVCDLVYNPPETPLLRRARVSGLSTIDGLGMLMHQGALAFELLYGVRPTVSSALRSQLELALRDGG